ncbi:MAG: hypothetical protein ABJA98_12445 [Acidobacteriota bacterium]
MTFRDFVAPLKWIDGRPLASTIEPYRWRFFDEALKRAGVAFLYSMVLSGRGKKNNKTTDLMISGLHAVVDDSPAGNQCYLVANDKDQAGDSHTLAKKIIKVNPVLQDYLTVKKNVIERKDGNGFLEVLAAGDAVGSHGKTFRWLGIDEIHGYRNWDLLEALAPDPSRLDAQTWITSYASIHHKPGVPLFDLMHTGRTGTDPKMLFSWYAADFCTDPEFADKLPEERANPSMLSWGNPGYLEQQKRRLPAHKYRRLHLNLPGLPEGSAFQPEPIMDSIERDVTARPYVAGTVYHAFVDMSGGSSDDATLAIIHQDGDDRIVLDRVMNQGPPPPFDPNAAVDRFVRELRDVYHLTTIVLDRYAGNTFISQFEKQGVRCRVADRTKSELYEAFESPLNGGRVVLLDEPVLEQQLFGLIWRGARIDHMPGEHDDWANAVCGATALATRPTKSRAGEMFIPWLV